MRVIVTRPGPQAGKWVTALCNAGLDAVALPLIEIAGPPDPQAVRDAWQRLQRYHALMFVSANAVEQFFALQPAPPHAVVPASKDLRYWVTGPGSVAALTRAGVPHERVDAPDAAAAQFDSEALWQVVQSQVQPGWQVLVVRGNVEGDAGEEGSAVQGVGRDWLAARLRAQGAAVEFLVTYQRRAPVLDAQAQALVRQAACDGTVWLLSSSEAVGNLQALAPDQSWDQARAVATHARIAQAARAAGFGVVQASRPAMADLLASIESLA
ncbi:MAG: uroporphyrinogen-III synthase [Rhodoferax sp.]|nr:uroporphyrinogen-III synthase [Rhodoferax sp.]